MDMRIDYNQRYGMTIWRMIKNHQDFPGQVILVSKDACRVVGIGDGSISALVQLTGDKTIDDPDLTPDDCFVLDWIIGNPSPTKASKTTIVENDQPDDRPSADKPSGDKPSGRLLVEGKNYQPDDYTIIVYDDNDTGDTFIAVNDFDQEPLLLCPNEVQDIFNIKPIRLGQMRCDCCCDCTISYQAVIINSKARCQQAIAALNSYLFRRQKDTSASFVLVENYIPKAQSLLGAAITVKVASLLWFGWLDNTEPTSTQDEQDLFNAHKFSGLLEDE